MQRLHVKGEEMRHFQDYWIHSVQGCRQCFLGRRYDELSPCMRSAREGLAANRTFGYGPLGSKVMILCNNEEGKPPIQALKNALKSIGVEEGVYETAAVKCGTIKREYLGHNNLKACASNHLEVELEAIQPWLIWCHGRYAYKALVHLGVASDHQEVGVEGATLYKTHPWWSGPDVMLIRSEVRRQSIETLTNELQFIKEHLSRCREEKGYKRVIEEDDGHDRSYRTIRP